MGRLNLLDSTGLAAKEDTRSPFQESAEEQGNVVKHDSNIEVPRHKVEQLMNLWIEVFHESFRGKPGGDGESSAPRDHEWPPTCQTEPAQLLRNREARMEHAPWRDIVDIMSDTDVQIENKARRSIREEWRRDEKSAYLEDCWKHLWEPKSGVDSGLFQWPCREEKLKALQLDLVDALMAHSNFLIVKLYMRRDYHSIAPWISLIGLRLNTLYRPLPRSPGITPVMQVQVLTECLWCCNSFASDPDGRRDPQGPTIGDVLISWLSPKNTSSTRCERFY